jgi:hypothetical protein
LVSVTAYVGCGSSDGSRAEQDGGAGGEGGEAPTSAGGKNNVAGSQNSGGNANQAGGQGGDLGAAGSSAAGAGGAAGGMSTGGVNAGGEANGAAGNAGAGGDTGDAFAVPAACPVPQEGFVQVVGTEEADTFLLADVSGKKLIFGLGGDDIFPHEHGGDDCLVGGPGNDDFSNSDEFANYYVGGPDADTYHIDTTGNYVRITDMAAGDTISLSVATFAFLTGTIGEPPNSLQVKAVAGYSTGTPSGVTEGGSIVYDPSTGELWQDFDGGIKGSSVNDKQILTILNKDGYQFDVNDFLLED